MSKPCFEIGLVGAGAISAGAYTAGVIDFMVQALDEWYKTGGADGPPHDVKLSVFSGASAGAIAATLATAYLASDQPQVTTEAEAAANQGRNKLFDSWVDRIDIASLLQKRDLSKGSKVVSLLDSTVLAQIAESGLDVRPRATRRPYVADGFNLVMTVTNLRGVPYGITFEAAQPGGYTMSLHADYVRFSFSDQPAAPQPDRYSLTWTELGSANNPVKVKLKETALASGAFPVGLAPRTLSQVIPAKPALDTYSARLWPVPTPDSENPHQCFTDAVIPATWGDLPANYEYDYVCVDGGVMDNEPFELARRLLARGREHNPRDAESADKAVLLVDPFPGDATFSKDDKPPQDLLKLVLGLFDALKNQARFKADELVLAASPEVYSRFMIAPTRGAEKFAIACGSLGGFGGFLKRDFRKHDYFLGRRNAQKFFKDHFVLAETNPLFAGWPPELKARHVSRNGAGKAFLPIIPLVGEAAKECFSPQWPVYTEEDVSRLSEQLEERVDVVVDRLVDQYFNTNNFIVKFGASFILGRKKAEIVEFAAGKVREDLKKMKLMR